MNTTTVRNVLIVLVLAAIVGTLSGGVTAANVAIQAVTLAFLGTLCWFASIMYRQHRTHAVLARATAAARCCTSPSAWGR